MVFTWLQGGKKEHESTSVKTNLVYHMFYTVTTQMGDCSKSKNAEQSWKPRRVPCMSESTGEKPSGGTKQAQPYPVCGVLQLMAKLSGILAGVFLTQLSK